MRNKITYILYVLVVLVGLVSCHKTEHENIAPGSQDSTFTSITLNDTVIQQIVIVSFTDTSTINVLDQPLVNHFVDVPNDVKLNEQLFQIINKTSSSSTYSIQTTSVPNAVFLDNSSGIISVNDETIFQNETSGKIELDVLITEGLKDQTIKIIIRIGHLKDEVSTSNYPLHYFDFNNSTYIDFYENTTVTPSGDDQIFGTDSSGNINSAYSGASGKIIELNDINADIEQDFTVSLKFKINTDASHDALHYLISSRRGNINLPEAGGFSLFVHTDQSISLVFRRKNDVNSWANSVLNLRTETNLIEFGSWYHLVVRKTGGTAQIYLNQENVTEGIFNDFPGNNPKWQIGGLGDLNGSSIRNLDGLLDDLIIWDRAISDLELNESDSFTP